MQQQGLIARSLKGGARPRNASEGVYLSTVSCLIAPWEVFREMKRIKGPSLHLEGYSLRNEFAMNKVEKAGTRLPADASILWGNEMDAYENRIPIHYIKGLIRPLFCRDLSCSTPPISVQNFIYDPLPVIRIIDKFRPYINRFRNTFRLWERNVFVVKFV